MITVLITAEGRKTYLMEAVRSALNQTVNRDRYEIIVSKDFTDQNIDSFLDANSVTNMVYRANGSGDRVARAIKEANGEIISFLDDDDLFEKEKLERINARFKTVDIQFYKNSITPVVYNGNITDSFQPRVRSDIYAKYPAKRIVRKFAKLRSDFNSSSMSVRKEVLLDHVTDLRKIKLAVDSFYFYLFASMGLPLYYDSKRLSVYRIFQKSTSRNIENPDDFIQFKRKFIPEYCRDMETIKRISEGTDAAFQAGMNLSLQKVFYNLYVRDEDSVCHGSFSDYIKAYVLKRKIYIPLSCLKALRPWAIERDFDLERSEMNSNIRKKSAHGQIN